MIPNLQKKRGKRVHKFDFVLLNHDTSDYLRDLKSLESHNLLQVGAVVVAGEVPPFESNEYLQYVRRSGR